MYHKYKSPSHVSIMSHPTAIQASWWYIGAIEWCGTPYINSLQLLATIKLSIQHYTTLLCAINLSIQHHSTVKAI